MLECGVENLISKTIENNEMHCCFQMLMYEWVFCEPEGQIINQCY